MCSRDYSILASVTFMLNVNEVCCDVRVGRCIRHVSYMLAAWYSDDVGHVGSVFSAVCLFFRTISEKPTQLGSPNVT